MGQSNKRFCRDACRAKAADARKAEKRQRAAPVEAESVEATTRGLVDVSSPLGVCALLLARRLDRGVLSGESGSGMAALNREYRATLAEATAGRVMADPNDELRARREQRLRDAG